MHEFRNIVRYPSTIIGILGLLSVFLCLLYLSPLFGILSFLVTVLFSILFVRFRHNCHVSRVIEHAQVWFRTIYAYPGALQGNQQPHFRQSISQVQGPSIIKYRPSQSLHHDSKSDPADASVGDGAGIYFRPRSPRTPLTRREGINYNLNSPISNFYTNKLYSNQNLSPPTWNKSPEPIRRSIGVKTVQTVAGPLLASTRFKHNIDYGVYADVNSPGFSERIASYHQEANVEAPSLRYTSPGHFPSVRLNKDQVPQRSLACRPKPQTPVTLRVAPPVSQYQEARPKITSTSRGEEKRQSALDALGEISRKRIRGEEEDEAGKRHKASSVCKEVIKEDAITCSASLSPTSMELTSAEPETSDGKRPREEEETCPKTSSQIKKRIRGNEILSSLSSTIHMKQTKRKADVNWSINTSPEERKTKGKRQLIAPDLLVSTNKDERPASKNKVLEEPKDVASGLETSSGRDSSPLRHLFGSPSDPVLSFEQPFDNSQEEEFPLQYIDESSFSPGSITSGDLRKKRMDSMFKAIKVKDSESAIENAASNQPLTSLKALTSLTTSITSPVVSTAHQESPETSKSVSNNRSSFTIAKSVVNPVVEENKTTFSLSMPTVSTSTFSTASLTPAPPGIDAQDSAPASVPQENPSTENVSNLTTVSTAAPLTVPAATSITTTTSSLQFFPPIGSQENPAALASSNQNLSFGTPTTQGTSSVFTQVAANIESQTPPPAFPPVLPTSSTGIQTPTITSVKTSTIPSLAQQFAQGTVPKNSNTETADSMLKSQTNVGFGMTTPNLNFGFTQAAATSTPTVSSSSQFSGFIPATKDPVPTSFMSAPTTVNAGLPVIPSSFSLVQSSNTAKTSVFSATTTTATIATPSAVPSFAFGQASSASTSTVLPFSFGQPSNSAPTSESGGAAFVTSTATTAINSAFPSSPGPLNFSEVSNMSVPASPQPTFAFGQSGNTLTSGFGSATSAFGSTNVELPKADLPKFGSAFGSTSFGGNSGVQFPQQTPAKEGNAFGFDATTATTQGNNIFSPPTSSEVPGNFTFGGTPAPNNAPATQPTFGGFSFGSSTSAIPAATSTPMFGSVDANKNAGNALSTPNIFGAPPNQTSSQANVATSQAAPFAFGAPAPSTGFSFNATTTPAAPTNSNNISSPPQAFMFGAAKPPEQTGFNFSASNPQTTQPTQPFGFGASTAAQQPSFGFGNNNQQQAGPTFGTLNQNSAVPNFGPPNTNSFGFGQPGSTPSMGSTQFQFSAGSQQPQGVNQPGGFGQGTPSNTGINMFSIGSGSATASRAKAIRSNRRQQR